MRDYKDGQRTNAVKGISQPARSDNKTLRGIRDYVVKHFAFYYNNVYLVYKEAKYSVNYWLQELDLVKFAGTAE